MLEPWAGIGECLRRLFPGVDISRHLRRIDGPTWHLDCASYVKTKLLGSEDEGNQDSTISVFTRDNDGTLRHFYSVHPRLAEDVQERGIDEWNPIWNILDMTPQGRGSWYASLHYGTKVQAARH